MATLQPKRHCFLEKISREGPPSPPTPADTAPAPPHPTFRSQILICESIVPVPKMSPSGWNWAQVRAVGTQGESQRLGEAFLGEKSLELQGPGAVGGKVPPLQAWGGELSLTAARALIRHLGEDAAGLDVREGPVLWERSRVLSTERGEREGGCSAARGLTWSSEELRR